MCIIFISVNDLNVVTTLPGGFDRYYISISQTRMLRIRELSNLPKVTVRKWQTAVRTQNLGF